MGVISCSTKYRKPTVDPDEELEGNAKGSFIFRMLIFYTLSFTKLQLRKLCWTCDATAKTLKFIWS